MVEQVLRDHADAHGLRSVSFRYFNACGAHAVAPIGERHEPETHLIPNILLSLLDGGRSLKVFGDDYDTPDGSCVRDYVHVNDLCDAHLAAAGYLDDHAGAAVMNLGNGNGFSVFEVIDAVKRVTGREVEFEVAARRPGDPPFLVADAGLARQELDHVRADVARATTDEHLHGLAERSTSAAVSAVRSRCGIASIS